MNLIGQAVLITSRALNIKNTTANKKNIVIIKN